MRIHSSKTERFNCEKCGRDITKNQYKNHLKACDDNPVPKKERGEKLNGKSIWNIGLSKETDKRVKNIEVVYINMILHFLILN